MLTAFKIESMPGDLDGQQWLPSKQAQNGKMSASNSLILKHQDGELQITMKFSKLKIFMNLLSK